MHEPTDIDLAVKDFIAEASKEFAYNEPEPEIPTEPTAEVTTEQPNTAPVETPNPDPAERGLERLVAREVELRERETRLAGTEKEVEALRAHIRDLESRQISEDILNQIKLSPSSGLRALGLDPDEVVRSALVEKLGDKANDPEIKEMMERNRLRREMEALKGQIQAQERQRAAQEYFSKVASGANEYARNHDGLGKHAPTVAAVAKTNPDHVYAEIMEEITRDAAVRAAREPNGDVISYEEAANRVEKRWSAMKKLLVPGQEPGNPVTTPPGAASTQPKTSVEAKVTPPSTVKPPDKPIAPWLQKNLDNEEAIRLAIAEYNRGNKP